MQPLHTREEVTRALTLTQQADAVWTHLGGNPMQPYTDCVALLDRCAIGATPSPAELLQMVVDTANGKQTKAESLGYTEIAIARVCNYV